MTSKIPFLYCTIICLLYLLTVSAQDPKYGPLEPPNCGFSNVSLPKIVNGEPAKDGAWPWVVALGFEGPNYPLKWQCGGSVISSRHILTAAHCAVRDVLRYVRLGDVNLCVNGTHTIQTTIEKKTIHPGYVRWKQINDVAVLRLTQDIPFSDYIRPICLPVSSTLLNRTFDNDSAIVAGWGRISEFGNYSSVLREVQLKVESVALCEPKFDSLNYNRTTVKFDNRIMCAGDEALGKDSCQGDSGGPLMLPIHSFYYEIGVVSFGYGCARGDYPGIYSRVTNFSSFILSTLT